MKKFLIASVLASVTMLGCNTPQQDATRQAYSTSAEENRMANEGTMTAGRSADNPMANQGDMAAERNVQGRTDLTTEELASNSQRTTDDDSESIQKAFQDNLAEIELARLAQDRSDDQRIQELAAAIQRDHEEANQRLRTLSSNFELELSNEMPNDKRDIRERLEQLSGEEFDREYIEAQMELHEDAVAFYEEQRVEIDDPQLADYFHQTLPAIRNHLQETREVAAR